MYSVTLLPYNEGQKCHRILRLDVKFGTENSEILYFNLTLSIPVYIRQFASGGLVS